MQLPAPDLKQLQKLERLVGLPYVALEERPESVFEVVGKLFDGSAVLAGDVERVWNDALIVDCMEQPGAWLDHFASPRDTEIMIHAERLFGCEVIRALPIFLGMERLSYSRFDQRPRRRWPRPTVN